MKQSERFRVECVAYPPSNGPRYLAEAVRLDFQAYSNESLLAAQKKLEETLTEYRDRGIYPETRPLIKSLGLRARIALLSVISLALPIEHAHWNYRPNASQST